MVVVVVVVAVGMEGGVEIRRVEFVAVGEVHKAVLLQV